jgi:ATP-dependent Lon protease
MTASIPPPAGPEVLPILPLRNSVLFPASVVPVNVGRARSVRLIEESFGRDRPLIGVVAQKESETEDPEFADVHALGTVARVLKVIRLSSGNYSVVLQGVSRMRVLEPLNRTRRGPLRPRQGQEAHRRVPRRAQAQGRQEGPDPVPRRPARRRQDLAGRSIAAPSAASSCASRSAACATRPRSAATAAPTSARCPAASSRA